MEIQLDSRCFFQYYLNNKTQEWSKIVIFSTNLFNFQKEIQISYLKMYNFSSFLRCYEPQKLCNICSIETAPLVSGLMILESSDKDYLRIIESLINHPMNTFFKTFAQKYKTVFFIG